MYYLYLSTFAKLDSVFVVFSVVLHHLSSKLKQTLNLPISVLVNIFYHLCVYKFEINVLTWRLVQETVHKLEAGSFGVD